MLRSTFRNGCSLISSVCSLLRLSAGVSWAARAADCISAGSFASSRSNVSLTIWSSSALRCLVISCKLGLDCGRLLASFVGPQADKPGVGRSPVLPVVGRLEDRADAIVVGLRDRIVTMIVALGTADRQSQHRGRDDLDRVGDHVVAGEILIDGAVAGAVGAHSQHPGGNQLIGLFGSEIRKRRRQQFVAGELLDEELIPRFVVVESADHVVAIPVGPFAGRIHSAVAIAVGIADDVEPMPSPMFAVGGRGQQLVDESLVGVGRTIVHELLDGRWRGRQAGQVEIEPPDECRPIGRRRRSLDLLPPALRAEMHRSGNAQVRDCGLREPAAAGSAGTTSDSVPRR